VLLVLIQGPFPFGQRQAPAAHRISVLLVLATPRAVPTTDRSPDSTIHDRWIDKYAERHVAALAHLKAELEKEP